MGVVQADGLAGRPHRVRVPTASPGTSPTCRPGSSRRSAAPRPTGRARRPRFKRLRVQDQDLLRRHRGREPPRLADHARRPRAVLRPRREGDRLHAPPRPSSAAGQQQLQGVRQRRGEGRLQVLRDRPLRHQRRAVRRAPGVDPGRLQLPGRQEHRQVEHRRPGDPAGDQDRQVRPATELAGRADHPRRRRPRQRRAVRRQGRQPAPAGRQDRVRRGQLHRVAAAAAAERQRTAPGRAGQQLGPGGPQLHAAPHRVGLRPVRRAGAHVPRRDDGRHHRRRGPPGHLARLRGRLLHGDALARSGVPRRVRRTPGSGARSSPR